MGLLSYSQIKLVILAVCVVSLLPIMPSKGNMPTTKAARGHFSRCRAPSLCLHKGHGSSLAVPAYHPSDTDTR